MIEFVPSTTILIQFALAVTVLAITPGPDMALFIGRAITHSRAAGLACCAGASSGILIHTMAVALGLSALLVAAPTAFMGLKIVGAAYLVWLAWQAIRHGSSLTLKQDKTDRQGTLWSHYLTGLGINLLNPKIVLFFLTFLPQFVLPADPDGPGKLLFLGVFFLCISIPIVVPMIFAANRLADALRARPVITRTLDWLFAGVFGAFAIRLLAGPMR